MIGAPRPPAPQAESSRDGSGCPRDDDQQQGPSRGARATIARAALCLAWFIASLALVILTPWCTRDRIMDPTVFVAALRAHPALVTPGDLLLVHPPWRDDVVRAVQRANILPGGARATAALAPRHGEPLGHVVVISDGGLPLPRAIARLVDDDAVLTTDSGVQLARLRDSREVAAAETFTARLLDARVVVMREEGDVVCAWDPRQRRHTCPGLPAWMHVGEEALPIGGQRVRCVWAHPMTDARLVITFPPAPVGDEVALSLALTDGAAQNRAAAPVTGRVRVDGLEVLEVTRQPGERGFLRRSAPIKTPGAHARIEVEITTPHDGQRHTCFLLETSPRKEAR